MTPQQLHHIYETESGTKYPLPISRFYAWERFIRRGWTDCDLVLVLRWLRREISRGNRSKSRLLWTWLIVEIENFEDMIQLARMEEPAKRQKPIDANKASVLHCTGRHSTAPDGTARSAADVIDGAKAFENFKQWRKENGI